MKILTTNALIGATVNSTQASSNYPASNLIDPFLRLRYQASATADSIIFTLAEEADFNCFFIAYSGGVSSIEVQFLSGGEVQDIARTYIAATGDGNTRIFETGVTKYWGDGPTEHWSDYDGLMYASRHFGTLTGVDQVRVNITGTSPMYVGGMAGGVCIDMPPATAAWADEIEDNSTVTRSAHGQTQQNYIEPLKKYGFSFDGVTFADYNEIKAGFTALGGAAGWVTFFEESEEEFPPGYYSMSLTGGQRERLTYSFNIDFTEAR